MLAADRAELAGGLDDDLARSQRLARRPRARRRCARAAAGRRPAGACAGRSAAPSARRRPGRRCSDSASSSRLASTLVSGVRSSCEASATNWRWRASVDSVSPRAASSSRSMPSSVRASSATSSSACGWGTPREGSRVRAISAAVEVSSAIGAIARRAIAIPASSASRCPRARPSSRNSSTRLTVASVSDTRRRVLDDQLPDRLAVRVVHARPPAADARGSRGSSARAQRRRSRARARSRGPARDDAAGRAR